MVPDHVITVESTQHEVDAACARDRWLTTAMRWCVSPRGKPSLSVCIKDFCYAVRFQSSKFRMSGAKWSQR